MIEKPYDLVVMAGLSLMLIVSVGYLINSSNDFSGSTINNSFYEDVQSDQLGDSRAFKGQADDAQSALQGDEGASSTESQESFIVQGFKGLTGLGKSWTTMRNLSGTVVSDLGVPPEFITILFGMLIVALFVVIYAWWKS